MPKQLILTPIEQSTSDLAAAESAIASAKTAYADGIENGDASAAMQATSAQREAEVRRDIATKSLQRAKAAHAESERLRILEGIADNREAASWAQRTAALKPLVEPLAEALSQLQAAFSAILLEIAARDEAEVRGRRLAAQIKVDGQIPVISRGQCQAFVINELSQLPDQGSLDVAELAGWITTIRDPKARAEHTIHRFNAPHLLGVAPEDYAKLLLETGNAEELASERRAERSAMHRALRENKERVEIERDEAFERSRRGFDSEAAVEAPVRSFL